MLSQRAYAKHRKELGLPGGTLRAVQKAIRDQRIQIVDGKINPEQADAAWHENTNPLKQAAPQPTSSEAPALRVPPHSSASSADAPDESANEPAVESLSGKLLAIKIKQETLKLREQRRDFLLENKRLVDGRKVKSEMIERAAAEGQAVRNIPKRWSPGLAMELGVDERKIYHALSACVRRFLTERSTVPVGDSSSSAGEFSVSPVIASLRPDAAATSSCNA